MLFGGGDWGRVKDADLGLFFVYTWKIARCWV
jgi:hypothetical protein